MMVKSGMIIRTPKPNKDKIIIDKFRPITLVNVNKKLFTGALASRLKIGLIEIISEM